MSKNKTLMWVLGVWLILGALELVGDPLSSWREGAVKASLKGFVEKVTDTEGKDYIREEDRIAVLDLDGTLMTEHPVNFQRSIAVKRLREVAEKNPGLRGVQPWKAAWEGDDGYYNHKENHGHVFLKAFEGHAQVDYMAYVEEFLKRDVAPHWGRPFQDLIYKPGRELVGYLRENGFHVFICSTTEEGCLRVLLKDELGMKHHEVIGNEVDMDFSLVKESGQGVFKMKDRFMLPENSREGKCRYILNHIGKTPVLVFGNSMGDCAMLEYASRGKGAYFSMILDHDDGERELEYRDEEFLRHAREQGWTVVSMKKDFKEVH